MNTNVLTLNFLIEEGRKAVEKYTATLKQHQNLSRPNNSLKSFDTNESRLEKLIDEGCRSAKIYQERKASL